MVDPWKAATSGRKTAERKKTVRLAGNGNEKVHTLVKLHNWKGRAIYVYHLLENEVKRIDKPSDEEWKTFSKLGVSIEYPASDHPASDVDFWVQYGKEQATDRNLEIST